MTKKQRDIHAMMPLIRGKHVRIFHSDHFKKNEPFVQGTVGNLFENRLILINAQAFNGKKRETVGINTAGILKIELDNEKSPL